MGFNDIGYEIDHKWEMIWLKCLNEALSMKAEELSMRGKPYNSPENKRFLYRLQNGRCPGCEDRFEINGFEVDHITAKSAGGSDHIDNLQLLCFYCNRIKGDRGMEYLLWWNEGIRRLAHYFMLHSRYRQDDDPYGDLSRIYRRPVLPRIRR